MLPGAAAYADPYATARTTARLEDGYWRADRDFYRWSNIWRGASAQPGTHERLRHLAYAGGWKKIEPAWDALIRSRNVVRAMPMLERTLAAFGGRQATAGSPGSR
ncbi:hypothetical protein ACWD6R_20620 [Streptomyces sp. NPDC005151]